MTFTGYKQWVSLRDHLRPGAGAALIARHASALAGLLVSLPGSATAASFVRAVTRGRRTVRSVVEIGGLARTDQRGFGDEFTGLRRVAPASARGTVTRPVTPAREGACRRQAPTSINAAPAPSATFPQIVPQIGRRQ